MNEGAFIVKYTLNFEVSIQLTLLSQIDLFIYFWLVWAPSGPHPPNPHSCATGHLRLCQYSLTYNTV